MIYQRRADYKVAITLKLDLNDSDIFQHVVEEDQEEKHPDYLGIKLVSDIYSTVKTQEKQMERILDNVLKLSGQRDSFKSKLLKKNQKAAIMKELLKKNGLIEEYKEKKKSIVNDEKSRITSQLSNMLISQTIRNQHFKRKCSFLDQRNKDSSGDSQEESKFNSLIDSIKEEVIHDDSLSSSHRDSQNKSQSTRKNQRDIEIMPLMGS